MFMGFVYVCGFNLYKEQWFFFSFFFLDYANDSLKAYIMFAMYVYGYVLHVMFTCFICHACLWVCINSVVLDIGASMENDPNNSSVYEGHPDLL